jgi:hypothetical protein
MTIHTTKARPRSVAERRAFGAGRKAGLEGRPEPGSRKYRAAMHEGWIAGCNERAHNRQLGLFADQAQRDAAFSEAIDEARQAMKGGA